MIWLLIWLVKKVSPIVTEPFIWERKLNISTAFITQTYFQVPKGVRLNCTHLFIMKIPNKQELQQITFNHSSDTDFKDFMYLYKKVMAKPCSFLVTDNTLVSDNTLYFRHSLSKRI